VVGLGPGPDSWLTTAALEALHRPRARVFARTALHPALARLSHELPAESFDELYAAADDLDSVYAAMSERLLAALTDSGSDSPVVLAVPGDGALGEELLGRLRSAGVELAIVPGVPLAIGVLAAAGVAPVPGVQAVDAAALGGSGIELGVELNPRWYAVVVGLYTARVASDAKLALQRVYPPEHAVTLVRHAGLADQQVVGATLAELDRGRVDLDHMTHLLIPPVDTALPTGSAHGLRAVVARLRAPEIGCPWDLQQTHRSLIPYVIEEAYEVVEAIEDEPDRPAALADELGDVLLQVALHAEIAEQADEFDWNDVVRGLCTKLIRRHPHVFGEVQVAGAEEVVRNWDALKAQERGDDDEPGSQLDGVNRSLPGLKQAAELARKASASGFDWPERSGTLGKVREELEELLAAASIAERREELGDLLYVLAKLAADDGIDPEEALRAANRKFTARFHALEALGRERGWASFKSIPLPDLEAAWAEAKRRTVALD
jgi:tetrapyrrole methylase family protein/MazG family protein